MRFETTGTALLVLHWPGFQTLITLSTHGLLELAPAATCLQVCGPDSRTTVI